MLSFYAAEQKLCFHMFLFSFVYAFLFRSLFSLVLSVFLRFVSFR